MTLKPLLALLGHRCDVRPTQLVLMTYPSFQMMSLDLGGVVARVSLVNNQHVWFPCGRVLSSDDCSLHRRVTTGGILTAKCVGRNPKRIRRATLNSESTAEFGDRECGDIGVVGA